MPKKKTHEEFVDEVFQLVGDEYVVLSEYQSTKIKVLLKHNVCGYTWGIAPSNFLSRKSRCPNCNGNAKKTTESFINKVRELVGDEYKVLGNYKNSTTKIKMEHNVCGNEWNVRPSNFVAGIRCPKCFGNSLKTNEEFIKEVTELVSDEYTPLSEYINAKTKITMKHNLCGHKYKVTPNDFLTGTRCIKCYGNEKKRTEQFKEEVYSLVENEYEVLGEYINSKEHLKMLHNTCGHVYEVAPSKFLNGRRCPICQNRLRAQKRRKTHKQFIEEVYHLVGDEYMVLSEYKNIDLKIKLHHKKCDHKWRVKPYLFLSGTRCPKCNASHGELAVTKWLVNNNIDYIPQYKIARCRNINPLPFDFALFKNKKLIMLIEYNGEQHYKAVNIFGGEEKLNDTKRNDQIKKEYCLNNNIPLIEIPYWDYENIELLLNEKILGKDLIKD
jgi:Zn ribbon nucleic-acid-binding protein